MRFLVIIFWFFAMCAGTAARAQSAIPSTPSLACIVVTPQLAKAVQALSLGVCSASCRGCGCKGGPGYRAPNNECVGFNNINSVCGPPPHAGCRRECAPVTVQCAAFGRAAVASRLEQQGHSLQWVEAEPEARPMGRPVNAGQIPDRSAETRLLDAAPTSGGAMKCGTKRTCREMTSCDEAKFYFSQCGVSRLDGTGNGVPCKVLCR